MSKTDAMSHVIKVAVIGAQGRMGSEAVKAVEATDGLELVATYDAGDDLADLGGADVAVELTVPASSPANVAHCINRGVSAVVGTTGWDEAKLQTLRDQLAGKPDVGVLIAPNFSVGALLMMRFAAQAAKFYESVEVVEIHHPNKVDAPSGTAAHTASAIAQAREAAGLGEVPDATEVDPDGARGARVHGIPVHAIRMRGRVAHQEVQFGAEGEALTIRHDSFDRVSFMPGVLLGVRNVVKTPGLTVGLENFLPLE